MVPHKILKKLKLSEEKSVATVFANGDGNISKPIYHERFKSLHHYIIYFHFYPSKETIKDNINKEETIFRKEPKTCFNEQNDELTKKECLTDFIDTISKVCPKIKTFLQLFISYLIALSVFRKKTMF